MGDCLCRPRREVTENPSVLFYTEVKETFLLWPYNHELANSSIFNGGLMYVEAGNRLCFESTWCGCIGCECVKRSWDFTHIRNVSVILDERFIFHAGKADYNIRMNPGLKIELVNSTGVFITMLSNMPDAINFSNKLRQCLYGSSVGAARMITAMDTALAQPSLFSQHLQHRPNIAQQSQDLVPANTTNKECDDTRPLLEV